MPLIVAASVAVALGALALAVAPGDPAAPVIARVRLARGVAAARGARAVPWLRTWQPLEAAVLRDAALGSVSASDVAAVKVVAALGAALVVALAGAAPMLVVGAAYVGFVAPSLWIERRARERVRARRTAVLPFVERVTAMARGGATVERALPAAAAAPLDGIVREAVARADLGLPLFDALADLAEREGVLELRDLARELARARRGGRALLPVIVERREAMRLARRAERLEAASRVDGALSLVLVLAYLPALLALVVVPLFLGLLSALGT